MTNHVLGILRLDLGRPPVNEGGLQLLWVVDFPMFEALDGEGRPIPAHHPFTMPHPDDLHLLDSATGEDLLDVRADGVRLVSQAVVRFDFVDRQVVGVIYYHHCPWVLANARAVGVDPASVSPAAVQP